MTDDVAAAPESAGGELMAALLDLSSPQPNYKQMIDGPGLLQPSDGVVLTFGRELTEYVLRHHELFSSRVEMGLGNVRPLIPLNVDPPLHSVSQAAGPLIRSQAYGRAGGGHHPASRGFDRGIHRGRRMQFHRGVCGDLSQFGVPRIDGPARRRAPLFLRMRDGILHPEKVDQEALIDPTKRVAVMARTGQEIYDYFGALADERTKKPADE